MLVSDLIYETRFMFTSKAFKRKWIQRHPVIPSPIIGEQSDPNVICYSGYHNNTYTPNRERLITTTHVI